MGSDHCAFDFAGQKELGRDDFTKIPNGMPGVEERARPLNHGVRTGRISPETLRGRAVHQPGPRPRAAPRKGPIAPGAEADIVVWDPELPLTISHANRHGANDYSPYEGQPLVGGPERVYVRGALASTTARWSRRRDPARFVPRALGTHGARSPRDAAATSALVPRRLRELAELTGDDGGASGWRGPTAGSGAGLAARAAGGDPRRRGPHGPGREHLGGAAGRERAQRRPGRPPRLGPDGGWLDGALNVVAALEVLRAIADGPARRRSPLRLVDWADEEGARFGRSLVRVERLRRTLDPEALRGLRDRDGVALPDALARQGVNLDRMLEAGAELRDVAAYLELHIEQGPVLERIDGRSGWCTGIFGLQRHVVTFRGAHAHAGSTPMDLRRDAFLAAARSALAVREGAAAAAGHARHGRLRHGRAGDRHRVQRDLRADPRPARVQRRGGRRDGQRGARGVSPDRRRGGREVEWMPQFAQAPVSSTRSSWRSPPASSQELTGETSPRLPSGPLHDAAEMARVVPAVMVFVRSIGGVSHTKDEDIVDRGPGAVGARDPRAGAADLTGPAADQS